MGGGSWISSHAVLECWLLWSFLSLVQTLPATLRVVPFICRGHFSFGPPALWLLQYFYPLFCVVLEPWERGVSRCPICGWTYHGHLFFCRTLKASLLLKTLWWLILALYILIFLYLKQKTPNSLLVGFQAKYHKINLSYSSCLGESNAYTKEHMQFLRRCELLISRKNYHNGRKHKIWSQNSGFEVSLSHLRIVSDYVK